MNNTNAIIAILSVYSGVATFLSIVIFIITHCKKEKYVRVKQYITSNDIVKINFATLTKIILNYDKWFIRLVDKDKNECDIHFYKNRRCRRIMMKMGTSIIECHKAYLNIESVPYVSDKIYKGVAFKNKAFVIVNKMKAFITENTEIK
jgi:hypothetical protein